MKPFILGVFISAIAFKSLGQTNVSDSQLFNQLKGATKLENIMQIVSSYYKTPANQIGLANQSKEDFESDPMLWWARWALLNSSRLDEKGNVHNYSSRIMEAALILNKKIAEMPPSLQSNEGSWSFLGPRQTSYGSNSINFKGLGRVDRIAFHPSDANTIFIGTPGAGIWKTTDNGSTWTQLTKYLPTPGISGIVVSTSNPNTIFILTGNGDTDLGGFVNDLGYHKRGIGVLKSIDGGVNWAETGNFPSSTDNFAGYKLVQSPLNPSILLAATNEGLYRSTDGGDSWVLKRSGRFYDVCFKPNSGMVAFATGNGADRFIRSETGGNTWNDSITYGANQTPVNSERGQIAVSPDNSNTIYVLYGPAFKNKTFCGLFRSIDGGLTFNRQFNFPNILGNEDDGDDAKHQSGYDLALAVKPNNANKLFTGGTTIWTSNNGGVNMVKSTSYRESGSFFYIHPDIHDIKYHSSGWLYAATDGGIYKSNDDGVTWIDISPGVNTTQYYKGAGFEGDNNLFLGGAQDNGITFRPNNTNDFRFISCCDGYDVNFYPNDASKAYASFNTSVIRQNLNGGGDQLNDPWVNDKWFVNIATHPSNGNVVYIGADSICRSDDEGKKFPTSTAVGGAWALTNCKSNTNRIYAAGGNFPWASTGNIRRSDNQGATWTTINGNTFAPTNIKVTDIGVRPTSSDFVWATLGGFTAGQKVYRTSNGSAQSPNLVAWQNVSGSLPNVPINCIAIDDDNNAYIGTDIGIYYRAANMNDWVPFSNFLPRVPVTSLILNQTSGVIKATTFGQGLWQSPVYSSCPDTRSVTGSVTGYKTYEAGVTLSASANIYGGAATEVFLKSAQQVNLLPGFTASAGNNIVKVYIAPCGNGIPVAAAPNQNLPIVPLVPMLTNFPDGAIQQTPGNQLREEIVIKIEKDGNYELIVVDKNAAILKVLKATSWFSYGTHSIGIQGWTGQQGSRLQLLKNGNLVDEKEW